MTTIKEAICAIKEKPNIKHIVSVSGGKDSAALAVYLQKEYPQIPAEYVFCDTCCELPETDDYLHKLEGLIGKPITRVTAFDYLGIRPKPGRNPFDIILREIYSGFLPSPRCRWCTRALKIKPFEHYVGNDTVFSYIGIRADENREGYKQKKPPKLSESPNIIPVYPFKDDNIGLFEVKQLLEDSGLGFPKYYEWRSRSGCYFCFYQQIGEWQGLHEHHPELFKKAQKYEKKTKGKKYSWVEGRELKEIIKLPRYHVPTIDEVEGCAICHL
jgi:3'-phosphoadenosine 5'-phosphosulfate sulfotransferase (PAPS reductase)/FAD synthetase